MSCGDSWGTREEAGLKGTKAESTNFTKLAKVMVKTLCYQQWSIFIKGIDRKHICQLSMVQFNFSMVISTLNSLEKRYELNSEQG